MSSDGKSNTETFAFNADIAQLMSLIISKLFGQGFFTVNSSPCM